MANPAVLGHLAPEIKRLAADFMREPELVEVARQTPPAKTSNKWCTRWTPRASATLLVHLLQKRAASPR